MSNRILMLDVPSMPHVTEAKHRHFQRETDLALSLYEAQFYLGFSGKKYDAVLVDPRMYLAAQGLPDFMEEARRNHVLVIVHSDLPESDIESRGLRRGTHYDDYLFHGFHWKDFAEVVIDKLVAR